MTISTSAVCLGLGAAALLVTWFQPPLVFVAQYSRIGQAMLWALVAFSLATPGGIVLSVAVVRWSNREDSVWGVPLAVWIGLLTAFVAFAALLLMVVLVLAAVLEFLGFSGDVTGKS